MLIVKLYKNFLSLLDIQENNNKIKFFFVYLDFKLIYKHNMKYKINAMYWHMTLVFCACLPVYLLIDNRHL